MTGAGIQVVLQLILAISSTQAGPKHVMFAFVDHFEPSGSIEDVSRQTTYWVKDYIAMAGKHTDADGRHPVHSYFVVSEPAIQADCLEKVLNKLNEVTYTGYGEVELHVHHGVSNESLRTEQAATDELISFLNLAKKQFNMHGALITAETQPKSIFGFIHGMWALDNSRLNELDYPSHYEYCGVNQELDILNKEGVFADFTFPCSVPMTPSVYDVIFYAADDNSPASYQKNSNVFTVAVNRPPRNNLMIIQGPDERTNIGVKPGVYDDPPSLDRMDLWVEHNVNVTGNDKWIFIKVYTHGLAAEPNDPIVWDNFFGKAMDKFYRDIEKKYNDGKKWKLHYFSAREMYNIIKAAEAGKTGNPNNYRNFIIPPYANMVILTENRYRLVKYDTNDVKIEVLGKPAIVDMRIKGFDSKSDIFESDEQTGIPKLSDVKKDQSRPGELHLVDGTVSKFYDVVKKPSVTGK